MDRSYLEPDTVHVYASVDGQQRGDKPVEVLRLVPYVVTAARSYSSPSNGLVSYKVAGVMLRGYVATDGTDEVRAFLDRPHFTAKGLPA